MEHRGLIQKLQRRNREVAEEISSLAEKYNQVCFQLRRAELQLEKFRIENIHLKEELDDLQS